jgi:hypothetical protein
VGAQKNELILFYAQLELTIIVVAGRLGGALACGSVNRRRSAQSSSVSSDFRGKPNLRKLPPGRNGAAFDLNARGYPPLLLEE